MEEAKVGDTIRIDYMDDCGYDTVARTYVGKTGVVKFIDSMGQLHGTWGSLAVCPDVDEYTILEHGNQDEDEEFFNV